MHKAFDSVSAFSMFMCCCFPNARTGYAFEVRSYMPAP